MHRHLVVSGSGIVLAYQGRVAVARSDVQVPRAALTAVIGPNGSGKTTLLHAIAGLVDPAEGVITVSSPSGIAYVLQGAKVNDTLPITVAETVMIGRYARLGIRRRITAADRAATAEAMDRLGVADLADRRLTELSGGQRQRVFVAQGLAQDADLLLLDEPLTGLDLISTDLIRTAVETELARGRTVIVTTHDIAEAHRADHVILMAGRVHTQGPPADTLRPQVLSDAYGIGIVHLEDGSIALDDAAHADIEHRHIHYERGTRRTDE